MSVCLCGLKRSETHCCCSSLFPCVHSRKSLDLGHKHLSPFAAACPPVCRARRSCEILIMTTPGLIAAPVYNPRVYLLHIFHYILYNYSILMTLSPPPRITSSLVNVCIDNRTRWMGGWGCSHFWRLSRGRDRETLNQMIVAPLLWRLLLFFCKQIAITPLL